MTATPVKPLAVLVQPACTSHKWIRTAKVPDLAENPERIRAVLVGVAAAIANLEQEQSEGKGATRNDAVKVIGEVSELGQRETTPDISSMLGGLSLGTDNHAQQTTPGRPSDFLYLPSVSHPAGVADPSKRGKTLLNHPALQYVHSETPEAPFPPLVNGSMNGTPLPDSTHLRSLLRWCLEAPEKIRQGKVEIPSAYDGTEEGERLRLNVNDLYLGPGSIDAIEGSVLTVSQAVDLVCRSASVAPEGKSMQNGSRSESEAVANKAFCVIRPPGHHCGQDVPSGFCYVNNVLVGAMHGYLTHEQDRAVIIDIDLHHGNGTQAILMNLNEASHIADVAFAGREDPPPLTAAERANGGRRRRGWKGFYGSLHDIYSYPCEDGSIDLVKDASVSVAAHGQYVENIHLGSYASEEDFYERLYPRYLAVFEKAKQFILETEADPDRTTVYISAGFDACEHEMPGMQRHQRGVPVSFYERITKDIAAFAETYAKGKVVSVLEGGYSDLALISASMSHVAGFFPEERSRAQWWQEPTLEQIEHVTRKLRNGKTAPLPKELRQFEALKRSHDLFDVLNNWGRDAVRIQASDNSPHEIRRVLRDRSKLSPKDAYSPPVTTRRNPPTARTAQKSRVSPPPTSPESEDVAKTMAPTTSVQSNTSTGTPSVPAVKPLPETAQSMGEIGSNSTGSPSAHDAAHIKTETANDTKLGEKVILRFKNPSSHRKGLMGGSGEKPYGPPPAKTGIHLGLKDMPPPAKTGIHLGLKDMHTLVSLLEPLRIPYVHIAGTNGKGSVSAMIDSCALAAHLTTGRYNSPHLVVPRDAILINGQPVSQEIYDHHRDVVKRTIADNHLQNSEFEIETATAFSIFANAEPPLDLLLIECGMGGLRDATNVLDKSRQICSILTVVDLDHQKFLGNTIEEITTDKLGITKPGGHLIVSRQIHHNVINVVHQRAKEVGFSYDFADDGSELQIALPGRHQQQNASTAVAALKHIQSSPKALHIQPRAGAIGTSAIQVGLQKTQWRGRCSWLKLPGSAISTTGEIPLLVDGAHNESAAVSLMNYIDSIRTDEPIVFIVALSHSRPKTPLTVLRPMLTRIRKNDKVLPVRFSTPVAGMPWIANETDHDIRAAAIASGLSKDQIIDSHSNRPLTLREGLQLAVHAQKWGFVVVTGSLYLVADAYRLAGQ